LYERVVTGSGADGLELRARDQIAEHYRASGMTAPAESEIVPVIVPRLLWPNTEQASKNTPSVSWIFTDYPLTKQPNFP
jgi:hypothetical protein